MACIQRIFWGFNQSDIGSGLAETLYTTGDFTLSGQATASGSNLIWDLAIENNGVGLWTITHAVNPSTNEVLGGEVTSGPSTVYQHVTSGPESAFRLDLVYTEGASGLSVTGTIHFVNLGTQVLGYDYVTSGIVLSA